MYCLLLTRESVRFSFSSNLWHNLTFYGSNMKYIWAFESANMDRRTCPQVVFLFKGPRFCSLVGKLYLRSSVFVGFLKGQFWGPYCFICTCYHSPLFVENIRLLVIVMQTTSNYTFLFCPKIAPLVCNVHKLVKNLGAIFDSELIFDM